MAPNAGPIAVFGTRGQLPRAVSSAKTSLELQDALAAACAADGYARATGELAILATRGRVEALRAATVAPVSWGDRVPLIVVNLVPDSDADTVRATYEPVVGGSITLRPNEDVGAAVGRVAEELGHGLPVQLVAHEGVDQQALLDALSELEPTEKRAREPDPEQVGEIAAALGRLARPVLLLGKEGVARADPAKVRELAAKLECPVLFTATAALLASPRLRSWKEIFERDPLIFEKVPLLHNPNAVWVRTFLRADGVLALGTPLSEGDLFGLSDLSLPRGKLYWVDEAATEKRAGSAIHVPSDPGAFVEALLAQLGDSPKRRRSRTRFRKKTASTLREFRSLTVRAADRARDRQPIDSAYAGFLIELRARRRSDTVFVTEGSSASMWLRSFLGLRPVVFPMLMGSIGTAVPAAAGVRLGRPHSPVWAVVGDGGFFYQPRILRDLARLEQPIVFFVLNDSGWNSMRIEQSFVFSCSYVGTALPDVDYAKLAELHGCEGMVVRDRAELDTAVNRALDWSDSEQRPLVVDVRVAKDTVPFAGIAAVLAELDHITRPMMGKIVWSFFVSALKGKVPWRIVFMTLRLTI